MRTYCNICKDEVRIAGTNADKRPTLCNTCREAIDRLAWIQEVMPAKPLQEKALEEATAKAVPAPPAPTFWSALSARLLERLSLRLARRVEPARTTTPARHGLVSGD